MQDKDIIRLKQHICLNGNTSSANATFDNISTIFDFFFFLIHKMGINCKLSCLHKSCDVTCTCTCMSTLLYTFVWNSESSNPEALYMLIVYNICVAFCKEIHQLHTCIELYTSASAHHKAMMTTCTCSGYSVQTV